MTTNAFTATDPSTSSYWRALILFGRNVASYKFALAKSLLELAEQERQTATLEELAEPFSRHICEHLKEADKQGTFPRSRFLDACRAFNRGEIEHQELIETTATLGFANVIDAFHILHRGPVETRFFEDERKLSTRGIRLTDNLLELREDVKGNSLPAEAEARWRLVETAWELNLPAHLLTVKYDADSALLLPAERRRRKPITSARDSLNGYQKGSCFYCFGPVAVVPGPVGLAEVDHFFPFRLAPHRIAEPIDGVWNLVLACARCNGAGGKSGQVPAIEYLGRLHRRNEFLIASHHPLRETLIPQTGATTSSRRAFLNRTHKAAVATLPGTWRTPAAGPATF